MQSKKCLQCGLVFHKRVNESKKDWVSRHKFCSRNCVNLFQQGKPLKYSFPKGYVPWNKGKKHLAITGKKHSLWKGEGVSYINLHRWVYRHRGRPNKCEYCGTTEKRKYHWANVDGKYKRKLSNWIRLCVPCHKKYDRLNK